MEKNTWHAQIKVDMLADRTTGLLVHAHSCGSFEPQMQSTSSESSLMARWIENHDPQSLTSWVALYWKRHFFGMQSRTVAGQRRGLVRFLRFFYKVTAGDDINNWTPVVSMAFAASVYQDLWPTARKASSAVAVRRMVGGLQAFARWVNQESSPCACIVVSALGWEGSLVLDGADGRQGITALR